jgi:transcriptional regulator GlxA family with amidase domain
MDIRQITYFMLVYEEKSVSRAAAKAKVAQPAVSMQIKHLEEEFGFKLFERTQSGVEPTRHAARFYRHCIGISRSFSLAQQEMRDIGSQDNLGGSLRIGLPGSVTRGLLTRILSPFLISYPDVDVTISEAYTGTLVEWVKSGTVDFAVGARPQKQRGLMQRLLYRDGVVVMSGTPLNGPNFAPIDLTKEPALKLILPSAGGKVFDRLLKSQRPVCSWLVEQWQGGAWLAANCTGTFVLAETGLLDGRIATTTWWLAEQFRSRFPSVVLQLQPIITECDRLICAGASASYLLQMVRVVDRFSGPVIASQCTKSMLIDVSQTSQTPYLPLLTHKEHSDSIVHRAQRWLEKNMAREILISELSSEVATSERTLIRRFKAALNQTPLGYLQDMRIEAARTFLETGDLSISVIAGRVGYSDTSSFSRLFKERMGLSPGAYRSRFRS